MHIININETVAKLISIFILEMNKKKIYIKMSEQSSTIVILILNFDDGDVENALPVNKPIQIKEFF